MPATLSDLGVQLSAHVDVFKDEGGEQHLVHTSRPCPVCGDRLLGAVVPIPGSLGQVHLRCKPRLPALEPVKEVPV
jgi:hypothetical protein